MGLPEDQQARLRCYRNALRNEALHLTKYPGAEADYVVFKRRPQEFLRSELAEYSLSEIIRLLQAHVESGGKISEVVEDRDPGYALDQFHYDMRVPIGGRRIYFETILMCEDADDADSFTIVVVNAKDA